METGKRISDLALERLAHGEVGSDEAGVLREQIASDPEARFRLSAIEHDDQVFAATHNAARGLREIERRAGHRGDRARLRRGIVWATPALGVLGLLVVLARVPPTGPPANTLSTEKDTTRLKGLAPRLLVFRKESAATEAFALDDGATVRAHDVIQAGYVAAGRRYGAVLSIDGRGAVTVHAPTAGQPAELESQGRVLIASAYELDDAPRFERFILVTSSRPFALETVLDAARRLASQPAARTAALPLPSTFEQTSVVLNKQNQAVESEVKP